MAEWETLPKINQLCVEDEEEVQIVRLEDIDLNDLETNDFDCSVP